jgi:hypothetical protein
MFVSCPFTDRHLIALVDAELAVIVAVHGDRGKRIHHRLMFMFSARHAP